MPTRAAPRLLILLLLLFLSDVSLSIVELKGFLGVGNPSMLPVEVRELCLFFFKESALSRVAEGSLGGAGGFL
jgi:hypothetical protein